MKIWKVQIGKLDGNLLLINDVACLDDFLYTVCPYIRKATSIMWVLRIFPNSKLHSFHIM